MLDKITVYILTYNRPDYLAQCLVSLRAQTFKFFKTVVLDNCSTQCLDNVISEFSDLQIEYIKHESNLGSTGNFTFAWQCAKTTDYFVVFHDDDLMHSRFLELEVGLLEANCDLVWVASDSISFKGTPPPYPLITKVQPTILAGAELALGLIRGLGLTFSSAMYRSNTSEKVDLANLIQSLSIIFDRPILFELVAGGKCALIQEPLILYRCHDKQDSKTGPVNEDNLQELFISYKKLLMNNWAPATQKIFFSWSGFQLVDGYNRLGKDKKSLFRIYLQKIKAKGIYKDRFFYYYLCGLIKSGYQKYQRALKILATDPMRFISALSKRLQFHKIKY